MTLPQSLVQTTLVASETTFEVGSVSEVKKTMVYEEYILKTLEHLAAENSEVKKMTSKIKRLLGEIL